MVAGIPKRIMAGGTRSQSATPTSKRKTRGQSAACDSKAEPDQGGSQNGAAQNGSVENADSHANGASDVSAAPASSGKTSSQEQTYSEQELIEEATAGPDEALQEEEQLRKQREADEARNRQTALEALRAKGHDEMLNTESWRNLETLLSKAGMYTQFLTEQLSKFDEGLAGSAEQVREQAAEDADAERKGKRKAGSAGRAAAAKKAKKEDGAVAKSATQEMLPLISGDMRTYQLKGVKWLMSLHQNGLNGILADQMGLGKTVQTIGFLSHLRANKIYGPFLVIGPLSTLPNWVNEFKRWSPEQPVILYHGSKSERAELRQKALSGPSNVPTFPVIVTSFEIVIADSKFLAKHKFKYLVVDEGHRLKNYNCRLLRELRTIPAEQKLLLTGTPLQNNLGELWSLLNFLLPEVFSDVNDFESWFDFGGIGQSGGDAAIIAQEQRNKVVTKLHSILKPFLLRRVKTDVESALPGKLELVLYAPMAPTQRKLNDQLLKRTLEDQDINKTGGTSQGVSRLNNMLMQMRKVANHPDLVTAAFEKDNLEYPPAEQLIADCGKMALLDRLLTKLHAKGHKVLIFSQMTKMLDLLHVYLEEKGHRPARIDGSIPWQERQESMNAFNTDPNMFVFLLSTRAGGLGINLTAADTCIIYDSDWNPHQDLQAMDRCHRIGQTRPVLVFRLATAGSVEGKLLARAGSKLLLEKLVIKRGSVLEKDNDKEKGSGGMTADDLLDLLKTPVDAKSDLAQSGVVDDKMLDRLLDRGHLERGEKHPYPATGKGYQCVQQMDGTGLLKGVA